jgi:hypothetical protein
VRGFRTFPVSAANFKHLDRRSLFAVQHLRLPPRRWCFVSDRRNFCPDRCRHRHRPSRGYR